MKLLIPAFVALASTSVDAARVARSTGTCDIYCPNGMKTKVTVKGGCDKGGNGSRHLAYHKSVDKAIKKACFEEIDSMQDKYGSSKITDKDVGYWKALWRNVEEQEGFGCSMDGLFDFNDNSHDGCRLHDICYNVVRRWDRDSNKVVNVGSPYGSTASYSGANGGELSNLEYKHDCDSDQFLNHQALGAGGHSIRFGHWLGFSNGAYRSAWSEGIGYYRGGKDKDGKSFKDHKNLSSSIKESSWKNYMRQGDDPMDGSYSARL